MWNLIEKLSKEVELDYLQVVEFTIEDDKVQKIKHSQEVSEYEKTYIVPMVEDGIQGKVYVIYDGDHCTMLWADECQREVTNMWYVLGGMATGIVVVAVAECFVGRYAQEGVRLMANALLFLFGFTSIVGVYEVAKSGGKSKTNKIEKSINDCKKILK